MNCSVACREIASRNATAHGSRGAKADASLTEPWKSSGRCAQRRYVYDGAGRLACGRAAERFDADGHLCRERQRLLLHQGQSTTRCACGGQDAQRHGSRALRQRPEFIVGSRRTRGELCGTRHEAICVAEHLQFPDMISGLGGNHCHRRGPIVRQTVPPGRPRALHLPPVRTAGSAAVRTVGS